MAKTLLPDELWTLIEQLLPPEPPKPKGVRPRLDNRMALTGILFVLKTGCPWGFLLKEMGCGSGMTCWRRLRNWHEVGVWARIHHIPLDELGQDERIDWARSSLDSSSIRVEKRALNLARILRTGGSSGRSTTSSSMARASHSRR